jgi:hypothetical protein
MKTFGQPLFRGMFFVLLSFMAACKGPSLMTKDTNYVIDVNHIDSSLANYPFKRISQGKIVTLTLLNLNKSLYSAEITTDQAATTSNLIPAAFNPTTLALPGQITELPPTHPIYLDANFSKGCRTALSNLQSIKDSIDNQMKVFSRALTSIEKLLVFNNKMITLQKKCGISFENEILPELNRLADSAVGAHTAVPAKIDAMFKMQTQAALISYHEIQRWQDDLELLLLSDTSCKTQYEKDQFKDFTPRTKDLLKRCTDNYTRIQEYLQNDQIAQIIQLYQTFTKGNYTLSIQDTATRKDKLTIGVTLTPKTWIPCDPVKQAFSLSLKLVRWKIDFSTGVFFNYGNRKFRGNYFYIDSSDKIARLDKNDGAIIPAFGGLMHIYRRSGRSFDWGGEIGASLDTDLNYSNFYLGACFMINADNEMWNRVVFSAGLALRRVKELGHPYHIGAAVDPNLSIDQLEQGRYRTGAYIGLTYNLRNH